MLDGLTPNIESNCLALPSFLSTTLEPVGKVPLLRSNLVFIKFGKVAAVFRNCSTTLGCVIWGVCCCCCFEPIIPYIPADAADAVCGLFVTPPVPLPVV